ncbi:M48 family metallopeptidase [Paenibacillus sp. D51F]
MNSLSLNGLDRQATISCPRCGKNVPCDQQFQSWCECGWNIEPRTPDMRDRFSRLYHKLGVRQGEQMLEEVKYSISNGDWRDKLKANLLLYLVATIIHLVSLSMFISGVWLIVAYHSNHWFPTAIGMLMVAIQIITVPRLGSVDKKGLISREDYPTLYRVVDAVSDSLGTSRVYGVQINEEFNASFTQLGWRGRKVITLGLPLFAICSPQEKIALIAHETAHGANHDVTRNRYVWSAYIAAEQWYYFFTPARGATQEGYMAILYLLSDILMKALSFIPWTIARLVLVLLHLNKQRSEYYADYLGVKVSGEQAMIGLLEKLHYDSPFESCLHRFIFSRQAEDFITEWKAYAEQIPVRELERIRHVVRAEGSRLDFTHPPTPYRIDFLQHLKGSYPLLTFSKSEHEQLVRELEQMHGSVYRNLEENFNSRLYY